MRYMIWNNKGGVGKTFLSYLLASEYAKRNPQKKIIVADLCPQANVSEMLLGGNGKGEKALDDLTQMEKTIAGYIKARYNKSQSAKLGNETAFFVKVKSYNDKMPENLFLLPGDVDLDICSSIINYLAQAPQVGAWKRSRIFLSDLIESMEQEHSPDNVVCFIDCNPSFANYTEMSVMSANRLIIPCTADSASVRGIQNLFRVIYGLNIRQYTKAEKLDENVFYTFSKNAQENNVVLPKVHLIVQNKSRSLDLSATTAYRAHIAEIKKLIDDACLKSPEIFTNNTSRIINVKDGNTLAAIANHTGLPLSAIEHKKYSIYGKNTQANESQIGALLVQIQQCVDVL